MEKEKKSVMTNERLAELLSFDEKIRSVEIRRTLALSDTAALIVADLTYGRKCGLVRTVPFVYHDGMEWIFAPSARWDGIVPCTAHDVSLMDWRVDDTDVRAVIADGIPVLPSMDAATAAAYETRKRLGEQIRRARKAAGLSLRALADRCGVGFSHLGRIERSTIGCNIDTVSAIAGVLGLKITLAPAVFHAVVTDEPEAPAGEPDENGESVRIS